MLALCLLTPRLPGHDSYRCYVYRTPCHANYPSHVATGGSTPLPSPTVTTTVQSTYSGYRVSRLDSRLDSRAGCQQVAARIDRWSSRPSLNDRKDNMRASSLKISRTRNRILDTEKFSQVSRVSLTSLLFILCLHRHNQPNLNVSLQTLFINKFHIKSVLKNL